MLTHVIAVLTTIYLDYVGIVVLVIIQKVASVKHKKLDLRKILNMEVFCDTLWKEGQEEAGQFSIGERDYTLSLGIFGNMIGSVVFI